jgi:hypothetical protein
MVKTFSLLHIVQTGPRAHPASYPIGTGCKAEGSVKECRSQENVDLHNHCTMRIQEELDEARTQLAGHGGKGTDA